MSSWDRDWGPRTPKKPPPRHGIKIQKVGTTWWGRRWIEGLEQVLGGDAGRLLRGKTYARAGRTHDLVVHAGKVTAKVTGSRSTPYDVTVGLAQLSDDVWRAAIQRMAEKAQFAAELLAGRMPTAIDEVFRGVGTSLFPETRAELVTSCSCPDWGDPCKHVAATHYVLGEALDRDPFLLFELRGRSKDQVLTGLRVARSLDEAGRAAPDPTSSAAAGRDAASNTASGVHSVPRVTLGVIEPGDYDRAPEALPLLDLSFEAPVQHGALLRQLGAPPAWRSEASPEELLAPLVRAAAEAARRIALADPPADEGAAAEGAREGAGAASAPLARDVRAAKPAKKRGSKAKRAPEKAAPRPAKKRGLRRRGPQQP
jgi:uncharacterized Zn finger protein